MREFLRRVQHVGAHAAVEEACDRQAEAKQLPRQRVVEVEAKEEGLPGRPVRGAAARGVVARDAGAEFPRGALGDVVGGGGGGGGGGGVGDERGAVGACVGRRGDEAVEGGVGEEELRVAEGARVSLADDEGCTCHLCCDAVIT